MLPDILEDDRWQMSPGERAAIKGILSELQPAVAIEIGTGQGGSLRRIAASSGHVHAFDTSEPSAELVNLPNATFHTGDSHELLPRILGQLAEAGINVDFALVDGDHFADGVKRDIEDLLRSPAISRTLIVLHDTANQEVRAGLDAIDYQSWSKLVWVDLDWVPGFMFRAGPSRGEAWAGLGIMVVDEDRGSTAPASVAAYAYPTAELLAEKGGTCWGGSELLAVDDLRRRVADLERSQTALTNSLSWRLTRPLRSLKATLRR